MHDANAGRNQLKSVECLLAPLQKLVTLAVAFEFHFQVQTQRLGRAKKIDLNAVIDHQIHRHQRFDNFGVSTKALHRASHRRQID